MFSFDLTVYIFLIMPIIIWVGLWIRARQGFYQLLGNIPKSILVASRKGYILWWNNKAREEFPDWCNKQVCIHHIEAIDSDSWNKYINLLEHGQESIELPDLKVVNEDKKQHIHAFCSLLPFSSGRILLTLDDVTKEVDLEERLIQVDKMATLGLLSSSVVHDINNFLSGISQSVQNLNRKMSLEFFKKKDIESTLGAKAEDLHKVLDEINVYKSLDNINTSMMQALQISNGVLHYVRKGSDEKEEVNVNDILKEVVEIISIENSISFALKQKNLIIESNFEPELPDIDVVPIRIEQVFMNLLQNAVYSAMSYSENAKVIISTYFTDNYVCINISDNGTGIDKSSLNKIFEPFYTTKNENTGTGLGLHICKQIVCDQHMGDIDVDTDNEHGVAFIVKLPRDSHEKND